MSYAERTRRPPPTLTDAEQEKILRVTGKHADGFRDHLIISFSLGCGLRQSEIVALNVSDISPDGARVRRVVQLREFKRAGAGADPKDHRVHLPDSLYYKLGKYLRAIKAKGGDLDRPLFRATRANALGGRVGGRLSTRSVREMFRHWQIEAGFDQLYNFHSLRHTAITNVRRRTKDIRIAQRFARHVDITTTTRYEHASDEELSDATRGLRS